MVVLELDEVVGVDEKKWWPELGGLSPELWWPEEVRWSPRERRLGFW